MVLPIIHTPQNLKTDIEKDLPTGYLGKFEIFHRHCHRLNLLLLAYNDRFSLFMAQQRKKIVEEEEVTETPFTLWCLTMILFQLGESV